MLFKRLYHYNLLFNHYLLNVYETSNQYFMDGWLGFDLQGA